MTLQTRSKYELLTTGERENGVERKLKLVPALNVTCF